MSNDSSQNSAVAEIYPKTVTPNDSSAQQEGIKQAQNFIGQRSSSVGYRTLKATAEDPTTTVSSIAVSSIEQKLEQLIEILKGIAETISRFMSRRDNS